MKILKEMAKGVSKKPFLNEVYNVIKNIRGVQEIDGRSTVIYVAGDLPTITAVVKRLKTVFGKPAEDHPLLGFVEWHVGSNEIHVSKAVSVDDPHTFIEISTW